MDTLNTNISLLVHKAIDVRLIEDEFLRCPFHNRVEYHAHPEAELLYIIKGHGQRKIAGNVSAFGPGDMVFLQSMVPHVWLVEPSEEKALAILLYIDPAAFRRALSEADEFEAIYKLLNNGPQSSEILGSAHAIISRKLLELVNTSGFDKVMGTLEILNLIACSGEVQSLAAASHDSRKTEKKDPIAEAVGFAKANVTSDISVKLVSDRVGMTSQAFCRLFRRRMGIRFTEFLVSERIQIACDHLLSGNKGVAEIAELSGFRSLSHFCKTFRRHSGFTPLEYRKKSRR